MVALPGLEPGLFALRGRFLGFAGACTESHQTFQHTHSATLALYVVLQ
jgi:hypothetical protein